MSERGTILDTQKQTGDSSHQAERAIELGHRFNPVRNKVYLMLGSTQGKELFGLLADMFAAPDRQKRAEMSFRVFDLARRIIEQKQAGIADRIAAVERSAQQTGSTT